MEPEQAVDFHWFTDVMRPWGVFYRSGYPPTVTNRQDRSAILIVFQLFFSPSFFLFFPAGIHRHVDIYAIQDWTPDRSPDGQSIRCSPPFSWPFPDPLIPDPLIRLIKNVAGVEHFSLKNSESTPSKELDFLSFFKLCLYLNTLLPTV